MGKIVINHQKLLRNVEKCIMIDLKSELDLYVLPKIGEPPCHMNLSSAFCGALIKRSG